MKKFLIQIIIFSSISLSFLFFILYRSNGNTDPFYLRFTTPLQKNLILGTSKAAQGIQPSILKKNLNENIYNYSFTIAQSPYGNSYMNSIKKKLDPNTKSGIFIITVDPWSISSISDYPNKESTFREIKNCVATTKWVNIKPNIPYLLKNNSERLYKNLINKKSNVFLHNDGWLEVTVDNDSLKSIERRKLAMDRFILNSYNNYKFSKSRLNSLKEIINFLNKHGDVYIVRLPVHQSLFEIEKKIIPNLKNILNPILKNTKGYLDLTHLNEKFNYNDGIHLHKESGKEVTEIISQWILSKKEL